jgi:hypothetical protein
VRISLFCLALPLLALSASSCKPKAPPAAVTFKTVCSTAYDAHSGPAPDVTLDGYLTLPPVGTSCSDKCLLFLAPAPGETRTRVSVYVRVGTEASTMTALGSTYKLGDLVVRDVTGKPLDLTRKVRVTGWRGGVGGMGCNINPDKIEAAE